jgi:hypothetical protein
MSGFINHLVIKDVELIGKIRSPEPRVSEPSTIMCRHNTTAARSEDRGRAGMNPGRCYETPIIVHLYHYEDGTPEYIPPEHAREFLENVERNEGSDNPFGRYWPIVKGAVIGAVVFLVVRQIGLLDRLMNWWMGR